MNSGIYVEDKNLRRISMSVIRDIENIVDHYHENHAVLKKQRNQALLDTLRVFEDACRLCICQVKNGPKIISKKVHYFLLFNQVIVSSYL